MFKSKTANQKKTILIVSVCAAIVVLVVIIAMITNHLRFRSPIVFLDQPQRVQSQQENVFNRFGQMIYGIDANGRPTGVAIADEDAYQKAVRLYGGRVMQFNDSCQTSPATMILSGQSIVVLENQSVVTRSITIGPRVYDIAPNNFILVSFDKAGTYTVNCDSSQAVGYISVQ